jgi:4-amino-4-deoxy-L-arabinose transferase-like glycosyltransferase
MAADSNASTRRVFLCVGWVLLVWVALFWRLGQPTFWDPDEAHYAVTTRELLASGDWLAPTYNGDPFFDKPILFHDLQGAAMRIAGVNELGARVVPALAALALILTSWWVASSLARPDVAIATALFVTASPAVAALARYAILDSLFAALLFGAVGMLAVSAVASRPRLQWFGYVLLALATLTKGPLALALAGLTFVVAISVSRDARARLLRLHWIAGAALTVALAAPWFIYMYVRFGAQFVQGYILDENLLLFSRPPYGNQPGPTFYLQIIAVGMLPWTPVLIGRLWDRVWTHEEPAPTVEVLLWSWVATVVTFFSASQFKLDHYVFPAAPALYMLCAIAWHDASDPKNPRTRHHGVRLGLALVGPILMVAGIALAVVMRRFELPVVAWGLPVAWIVLGLAQTVGGSRGRQNAPAITAGAFGLFYIVAVGLVLPQIERQKVVADVSRWVARRATDDTRLCSYRLNRWNNSFLFYVGRPVEMTDSADVVRGLSSAAAPLLCVMPQSAYDELRKKDIHLPILYRREGLWATSGKALQRSRGSLTPFLVVGKGFTPPA